MKRMSHIIKGQTTSNFEKLPKYRTETFRSRSFSLFYDDVETGQLKSLDSIVDNAGDFEYLTQALQVMLTEAKHARDAMSPDMLYIMDMWDKADVQGDGQLSKEEVFDLIAMMNINMPTKRIEAMFNLLDDDKSGYMEPNEFAKLITLLRDRSVQFRNNCFKSTRYSSNIYSFRFLFFEALRFELCGNK